MTQIKALRHINAKTPAVWAELADLGSHVEWMKDATGIAFVTEKTRGVGTVMEVATKVGPFRTLDRIEVTGWVEGQSIDVVHTGLVTGEGTLSVETSGTGTLVSWVEKLSFPWWLGGAVTVWLAKPVLAAIWRGNLERLGLRSTAP